MIKSLVATVKKLPKFVQAFMATFLGLFVIAAVLYLGFGVSLEKGWHKLIIGLIMVGVPVYVQFRKK